MARHRGAQSARVALVAVVALATTGLLPHLVSVQAGVSACLTVVLPPLCLLDLGDSSLASRALGRIATPLNGFFALVGGTLLVQAPPSVSLLSRGGPATAAALVALVCLALVFWSVVIGARARVRGLAAAGYVVLGALPISMPAFILMLIPRDLYASIHPGMSHDAAIFDQQVSGFILFAVVKVAIFVAFTAIFVRAGRELEAGEDRGRRGPGLPLDPTPVPGWVSGLGTGPTVAEPLAERELARV